MTIGLGLGLNTALFTVFDAYVLSPLAIPDAHSLYGFTWSTKSGNGHMFDTAEFESLRRDGSVFTDVVATQNLLTRIDGNPMFGQFVSRNYFDMLRVGLEAGRHFSEAEARDDAVMVIGYDAWQAKFGSDPAIVGRKLLLKGVPVHVVGVAKRGFTGLGAQPTEFWVPLSIHRPLAGGKTAGSLSLIGRLRPDLSLDQARAQLHIWSKLSSSGLLEPEQATGAVLVSRSTIVPLNPGVVAAMVPVFFAFGLVLAGACVNVAGILMARALARSNEIGVRISLGAGRGRLIQQLLMENIALALPACAVGLMISTLTLRFAHRAIVNSLPPAYARLFRLPDLSTNQDTILFLVLATVGSVLLFGLLPALKITAASLMQSSKGEMASSLAPSRLHGFLVIAQIAICTLLAMCSVVAFRSRLSATGIDTHMDASGVYDVRVSGEVRKNAVDAMKRAGMQEIAAVWRVPWSGSLSRLAAIPSGSTETIAAGYNLVSPEYFQILKISLASGRLFSADEARSSSAVVVISEATARRFWPGRNPLGQTIGIEALDGVDTPDTVRSLRTVAVVGVVRDAVNGIPANGIDRTCIYFPLLPGGKHALSLLVRARGDAVEAIRTIERTLDGLGRGSADRIDPLDEIYALGVYPFHILWWISLALCGLSLLLMVTGVHGVTSSWVNQRRQELGIRMAVGASASSIMGLVLAGSVRLSLCGAAIGLFFAAALAPLVANQIGTVDPYDVTAYAVAFAGTLVTAVAASAVPAYNSARADPLSSLRSA
ncbi:MAG: ABC transporter permease [Bryobacteraceae bacterium]